MNDKSSARGLDRARAPESSAYELAEYGASWPDSDRVLVTVHGRDRTSDELHSDFMSHPISSTTHILAPYAKSKCWYDGRYDAPRAENAPGVRAGLVQIRAAFERAADNGIPASKIVLVGFSQGGCMVVEYLLSGNRKPAAAAIFTGSALEVGRPRQTIPDLSGIQIVISGGNTDPWLPVGDLMATATLLESAGAEVELQIFPDGDHVVRSREMSLLGDLVEKVSA